MRRWLAGLFVVLYLAMGSVAWAEPQVPPAPVNSIYVQDYAGVLSGETKNRINTLGSNLASKTKAQVVVVTVKSIGESQIEEYALTILRKWGIGDKTLNNGVLMLVAIDDHKSRIEVGYGLEGALPDAKTGELQDEYMLPYFRTGDYDKGIMNGYLAIVSVVAKEYKLELKTEPTKAVRTVNDKTADPSWLDNMPWWMKQAVLAGIVLLFIVDWLFLGGTITMLLLSILSMGRRGGGGGSDGFGGGSGGGGGSNRNW